MMKIVYYIGIALAIWCVYDLFKNKTIAVGWKILISIILLACSWLGVLIYYFFVRDKIK
ncbi:MAG: hypothetical protein IKX60_07850 [Bacteroidales bacterium]|nr:hypothetical protein [Bacteroidales bacterium]